MINVYERIDANKRKSLLVMILFVVFITAAVFVFSQVMEAGLGTVGVAMILAGLSSLGGFYYGDKLILAISRARPAERKKDFHFYTAVENLCLATQMPRPRLYVIDDSTPNAFATGRDPNHAVVCATTGLLKKLDRTEIEGVVAHELSHIKNYDTRLMSIVAILVGSVSLLADWFMRSSRSGKKREGKGAFGLFLAAIILGFLAPFIGRLIQLAISRQREFLADASAVMLTRFPEGLARALEKLNADKEVLEAANKATAHLYIVNPFKERVAYKRERRNWLANLFNTHPPIEERIKRLREMQ